MSKRASTAQCHLTVLRAQVYNSLRLCFLLKLFAGQMLVLTDLRLGSIMKRP